MPPLRRDPPPSREALTRRAAALVGHTFEDIAMALQLTIGDDSVRSKGKFGELLERALGAEGASSATHDFPALGVELKTVPLTARGRPQESTYVCTVQIHAAEDAPWERSWARRKLGCVLWVTTDGSSIPWRQRRVRGQHLWTPTTAEEATLRADYEEAMGLVQAGRTADLTAHLGRALQVRPKAANSRVRTTVYDADGGLTLTVPKGFYLRPTFTAAILAHGSAGVSPT